MDKKYISNVLRENIALVLIASLFSLLICELFLRVLPLSDKIGWNRVPSLSRRAERLNSKAKTKIVCLGDSFVEWRAGEGINMVDYVQKMFSSQGCVIVNLGSSGSDLEQYVGIYNQYVHLKPDIILLFLYIGNDIRLYPPFPLIDKLPVNSNQQDSWSWFSFVKEHSVIAHLVFRFCKIYIPFMRSRILENNLKRIKEERVFSDGYIQDRMKQLDQQTIELAKSDAINAWLIMIGAAFPRYYKYWFSLDSQGSILAVNSTISLIDEFYKKQKVKDFFVVLLPECIQVSREYDNFFKKCGFDLENFTLQERRKITHYIQDRLIERGIKTIDAIGALEEEGNCFIKNDMHLNKKGNLVVGKLIVGFLKVNYFDK